MAELPHLGNNCYLKDCNKLDFLPFDCQFCGYTFCLDHRTPTSHNCLNVPDCTLKDIPLTNENPLFNQCQYETCFKGEIFPVLCPKCGQNYCLEHRHPIDHYCEGLQREEEMEESAFLEKQLEIEKALQEFQERNTANETQSCKPQGRKSVEMAAKVEQMRMKLESGATEEPDFHMSEVQPKGSLDKPTPPVKPPRKRSKDIAMNVKLMKMKMKAVGPPSTLDNEKVFFTIKLPQKDAKISETIVYFKKLWSVGRSVDWITDREKLINRNNVLGAPKVVLFWSGSSLPLSSTWNELLISCSGLISGETLSLQYSEP